MAKGFSRSVKAAVLGVFASTALMAGGAATAGGYTLTDEQKRALVALLTAPKASPGFGIGIPTGFGAGGGQVFASIGGVTTDKVGTGDTGYDGSATLGFGIGDANEFLALELQANIISLTNNAPGSDFGEEGSVSLKVSRSVSPTSSISVGVEDITTWGKALNNKSSSGYVAFTSVHALSDNPSNPLTLAVTVGVGNERFQDVSSSVTTDNIGLFGGLSLAVHRQVALIVEHNGNYMNAGVSFVPLRSCPLTVTLSAVNVDEVAAADGGNATGSTEFGGSLGYSWNF